MYPSKNIVPGPCYDLKCNDQGMCNEYTIAFYAKFGMNPAKLLKIASSNYLLNNSVVDDLSGNKYLDYQGIKALSIQNSWGNNIATDNLVKRAKGDKDILRHIMKKSIYARRTMATSIIFWKDWLSTLVQDKESGVRFALLCTANIMQYPKAIKTLSKDPCIITRQYAKALSLASTHFNHTMCRPPKNFDPATEHPSLENTWKGYPCAIMPDYLQANWNPHKYKSISTDKK